MPSGMIFLLVVSVVVFSAMTFNIVKSIRNTTRNAKQLKALRR